MDNLIALVDRTELNTMVIDVKNDEGRVVYDMDSAFVREIGAVKEYVSDMPGLIRKCKEHGIYLIARIVAFKDPFLAENRQDLALTDKNGNIFRDKSGLAWVNPYKREVWDYLLEIARQAASVGFDEIQFDYIRFSTDAGMSKVDFGEDALEQDKEDVITEFTIYAAQELHDMGVPLSADVYGVIIDSKLDASIVGQNYYEMAKHLDYISPMVYPSHYGPGNLGLHFLRKQPSLRITVRGVPQNPFLVAGVINRLYLRPNLFRAITDMPFYPCGGKILQPGPYIRPDFLIRNELLRIRRIHTITGGTVF